MKPVRPVGIPTLLLLAFLTLSAPAQGQGPCPSASGPGAEAGWAAYADNDIAEARRRFEAAVALCGRYPSAVRATARHCRMRFWRRGRATPQVR